MDDPFKDIHRYHDRIDDHFNKLNIDRCCDIPEVGDTVVLSVGLLGMGHMWVMEEALVLKVTSAAYKVKFLERRDIITKEDIVRWIHPALVVAVIPRDEE